MRDSESQDFELQIKSESQGKENSRKYHAPGVP